MKRLISLSLILFSITAFAQPFHFHEDGTFRILQLTDLHYIHGNENAKPALDNLHKVISMEKPDLIVITGDIIYGEPAKESVEDVLEALSEHKIPFCTMFGNHDHEFGMYHEPMYRLICKNPYCVNAPIEQCMDANHPEYVVEIKSAGSDAVACVLYCLDSRAYSELEGVGGYGAFTFDQIAWYRAKSKAYKAANNGVPVPSVAFFHIPLPEYEMATNGTLGFRGEYSDCPSINSGMFYSMKEMGDIFATFCGHAHDDDFALDYLGICLCFGRYSGGSTVYNHLPNGGRMITLHEGSRSFDSYIRLRSGEIVCPFTYPQDFDRSRGRMENW